MTAVKKTTPSKTPLFKWEEGREYVCVKASSPGYREGETYTAYKNDKGYLCLKGRDGFEDLCSMLVSSFKSKKS